MTEWARERQAGWHRRMNRFVQPVPAETLYGTGFFILSERSSRAHRHDQSGEVLESAGMANIFIVIFISLYLRNT